MFLSISTYRISMTNIRWLTILSFSLSTLSSIMLRVGVVILTRIPLNRRLFNVGGFIGHFTLVLIVTITSIGLILLPINSRCFKGLRLHVFSNWLMMSRGWRILNRSRPRWVMVTVVVIIVIV